jgi:hypothetical protein
MVVDGEEFEGLTLDLKEVHEFWNMLLVIAKLLPAEVFLYIMYMLICLQPVMDPTARAWRTLDLEIKDGSIESEGSWFSRLRRALMEALLPILNLKAIDAGYKTRSIISDDFLERHLYSAFTSGRQSPAGGSETFPEQFPLRDSSLREFREVVFQDPVTSDEFELFWDRGSEVPSDSGFKLKEPPIAQQDISEAMDLASSVRDEFINTIVENVDPVRFSRHSC